MNLEILTGQVNAANECLKQLAPDFQLIIWPKNKHSSYSLRLVSIAPEAKHMDRSLLFNATITEAHTFLNGLGAIIAILALESSPITNVDIAEYAEYFEKMYDQGLHAIEFSDWRRDKQKFVKQVK